MREIKFRAWSKPLCIMYTPEMDKSEANLWGFSCPGGVPDVNNLDLMQFTGLKDSNGTDIYEGDIVKTKNGDEMTVSWHPGLSCFCLNKKGWAFSHFFQGADEAHECEICGNIYE